jgi:hypothetical protein
VEVRAVIETETGHGEHVFTLGKPLAISDLTVTLTQVRPDTAAEAKNPETGYWFVFEVRR